MRNAGNMGVILVLLGRKLWEGLEPGWSLSISVDAGLALKSRGQRHHIHSRIKGESFRVMGCHRCLCVALHG